MISTLFQSSVAVFTTLLDPAADSIIGNGLTNVAGPLTALLVIYVIVTGIMCTLGELTGGVAVRRIMRAGFVSMLLTATYFNPYVRDLFITTLPNWVASAVSNGTAANIPQQCDLIRSAMMHMAAAIYQNSNGIMDMDVRLETGVCLLLGTIFLGVLVLVSTLTHTFMVLTVCVAPFIIAAYLFDATKGFVEGWIGKAVGLSILSLLIAVTAQIAVAADAKMMINTANTTGAGLQEQVANLVSIIVFFLFMAAIILGLPTLAYSIGRGITINTGAAAAFAAPGRAFRSFANSSFNLRSR